MTDVLRYAAFTTDPAGGNPAGVVLDARDLDEAQMRAIAAELGYSETAFVVGGDAPSLRVRYFSPESEVPFCGHATIALSVAWGEAHPGTRALALQTAAGQVDVAIEHGRATLTSVVPRISDVPDADVSEALAALDWTRADLDPAMPPRVAYAGALHLVLAVATRERLRDLAYDFDRLRALMEARDWVTVALVHRRAERVFDARNPFPTGGVVEDPATGAAAAAFGAYLRAMELVETPADVTIHQGDDLGRPSLLHVAIPAGDGGISVSGAAVPLTSA